MGTYRTAEVCLAGHVITTAADRHPELRQKFCSIYGAETITKCVGCQSPIRGDYYVPGFIGFGGDYLLPRYCHSCGESFPGTESRLRAAHELADELEELSAEERELLKKSIDELARETPRTEVAAVRVKKSLRKVGGGAAAAVRRLLVDIASEAAKKSLGL